MATVAASKPRETLTRRRTTIASAITWSAKTQRSVTTVGALDASATWTGRPGGGVRFQGGDIFMVPFSLVWTGFVFYAGFSTLRSGFVFPDIILVFMMAVGLYMTAGRFLVDMYVRSVTSYALTTDSAVIHGPFGRNTVVYLRSVVNLNLTSAGDGSGSIYFGDAPSFLPGWGRSAGKNAPGFLYIDHAADVFERCKQIRAGGARQVP